MSKHNKYHGSGRLYTAKERKVRALAFTRTYLVLGYRRQLGVVEQRLSPYIRTEPRRHEGR